MMVGIFDSLIYLVMGRWTESSAIGLSLLKRFRRREYLYQGRRCGKNDRLCVNARSGCFYLHLRTFAPSLLVVTGGEMQSPRRNLPIAARRCVCRLLIFCPGSVLAISVMCASNNEALTDGRAGAKASAFTVGITKSRNPRAR